MTLEADQTSTLPLSERGIRHHTKLVSEVLELRLRQGLSENIRGLLVSRYIPKTNSSPLDHIT